MCKFICLLPLVAGASPYGVFPTNLYAAAAAAQAQAQGPPPTYDQTLGHPMVGQQVHFFISFCSVLFFTLKKQILFGMFVFVLCLC